MNDKMFDLKNVLKNGKTVIVCDANVYLRIYSYSPEYAKYALDCLDKIKEYLVMPSIIEVEYIKNYESCYKKMNDRVKRAYEKALQQISKADNNSMSMLMNLKKIGFEAIDELYLSIGQYYQMMKETLNNYFDDRKNTMELIGRGWGENDYVYEIYKYIKQRDRVMPPYSLIDIYHLCDEGRKRYDEQRPPGYKDEKKTA